MPIVEGMPETRWEVPGRAHSPDIKRRVVDLDPIELLRSRDRHVSGAAVNNDVPADQLDTRVDPGQVHR